MEKEKFQDLVLGHLVRLTQDLAQTKNEINERLDRVESAVVRIENEHGAKIDALFDAREVQLDFNREQVEFNQRIEKKIDFITEKVESLDREFDNKIRRIK